MNIVTDKAHTSNDEEDVNGHEWRTMTKKVNLINIYIDKCYTVEERKREAKRRKKRVAKNFVNAELWQQNVINCGCQDINAIVE